MAGDTVYNQAQPPSIQIKRKVHRCLCNDTLSLRSRQTKVKEQTFAKSMLLSVCNRQTDHIRLLQKGKKINSSYISMLTDGEIANRP